MAAFRHTKSGKIARYAVPIKIKTESGEWVEGVSYQCEDGKQYARSRASFRENFRAFFPGVGSW